MLNLVKLHVFVLSSLSTVRVEQPLKMKRPGDSRKRKHEDDDNFNDEMKLYQEAISKLSAREEEEQGAKQKQRQQRMLDGLQHFNISTGVLPIARAKSNKEKVKIERLLSAEEKVEPVKSKSREKVEKRETTKIIVNICFPTGSILPFSAFYCLPFIAFQVSSYQLCAFE